MQRALLVATARKRAGWLPAFERLVQKVEEVPSALFGLPVGVDDEDRPLSRLPDLA